MRRTLSKHKYRRIAEESLKNSLRLLDDAVLLYSYSSYPSAFQMAVLALEEFSKARWAHHVYYTAITNEGLPNHPEEEQSWLFLLYSHPEKQYAYLARDYYMFSPELVRAAESGALERKKQQAVYVGLPRVGKKVDVNGRVSTPARIKERDARQLISLLVQEFVEIYNRIEKYEYYFEIWSMDDLISPKEHPRVFGWPYRTRLKSARHAKSHRSS